MSHSRPDTPDDFRAALRKRISVQVSAGLTLLTLLAISGALGAVLSIADDVSGFKATRVFVVILLTLLALVLVLLLATLSRAVQVLLADGDDKAETRNDASPRDSE